VTGDTENVLPEATSRRRHADTIMPQGEGRRDGKPQAISRRSRFVAENRPPLFLKML
jgi:hypothetical protein